MEELQEVREEILLLGNLDKISKGKEIELIRKLNRVEKQLLLHNVSQQRELLNGFRQWLIDEKKNINIYQLLIDEYLNTI